MSNILAEVIQTRDAVTGDEFREMLQNVNIKLAQIKTDLVESLQSTFVLYESDIDKVTSWYVEILGIQEKVQELQRQFQEDRKALISATDDIETLTEELDHCDNSILLVKALVDIVKNVENADPNEFYKASKLVKSAQQEFQSILAAFGTPEDHNWVVGIRSNIADLVIDIYEKSAKELWTIFSFGKDTLTINKKYDVDQLIKTLLNIGYCSRVTNKLANNIWQELLSKACTQDYYIEITTKPRASSASSLQSRMDLGATGDNDRNGEVPIESASVITIKAVKASIPISKIEVVFNNIKSVLMICNDIFQKSPEVLDDFKQIFGPKICEELGKKCLKNLVLRNAEGDVEKAQENIDVMKGFIEEFARTLNFEFPEDTIFDELEADFEGLFLSQVRQDLLVKIRSLIKANLHDTQEVVDENPSDYTLTAEEIAALHRNPSSFPHCVVSKSVIQIVNVLKTHMQRYPEDCSMCDATFNLYLALMKIPKHESEAGDLAPFSAALVHNNCIYLAHHACFTFPMSDDKVPELRAKSTQAYSFMLRTVRTKLNSMISEAMTAMLNQGEASSDAEINNFLKISAEFVRLNGMFEVVLTSSVLTRTLVTLVDHTVNEICSKVLTWDDISAVCANNLASAFTQFAVETSDLFKGNATNTREAEAFTAKCVSKWNRFRMLTFVLTASMKEIEDKWVDGCGPLAMEFKAEELRKLVRALFQNTDRRAAFLASIK